MEILIPIFLLLALLVWIILDRLWILRIPPILSKETEWSSSEFDAKRSRRFCIGMAGAMYLFALNQWLYPIHPPFTGKLAALTTVLYQSFGPKSPAVFTAALATFLLASAFLRKKGIK